MSRHVHELLHLALSTEPESLDALYILCVINYPKPIIGLVLSDSSFTSMASVIIQSPDDNSGVIGRLASLTAVAFISYPQLAINSCWFLNSLLRHLDNTSVFALFQKLCTYEPQLKAVSKWLYSYGFAHDIINELAKLNFNRKVRSDEFYTDPEVLQCSSLYQIIIICSNNPVLLASFACEEMVIALSQTFLQAPSYLTGKRWEAIRAITCKITLSLILPLVANAVSLLYTPHTAPLQDVVEPVYFITKAAELSKDISKYLKETQIFQVLLRYILQFPDSTLLHAAFREFVFMSFNNPELCPVAIEQYLQILIAEAKMHSYGALTATFWNILLYIQKNKSKNDILKDSLKKSRFFKEFQRFAKSVLNKYKKLINSDYGGRIEIINKPRIVD